MRIVRVAARDNRARERIEAALARHDAGKEDLPVGSRDALVLSLEGSRGCAGGLVANLDGDWLFIETLVVDETKRGQGHGTRLLVEAERIAADRGVIGAWLVTRSDGAARFYARSGYRLRAGLPGRHGQTAWHIMCKPFRQTRDLGMRDAGQGDAAWLADEALSLGGPVVVSGGEIVDLRDHPARIATDGIERLGFTICRPLARGVLELVAIKATTQGIGVGRLLIADLLAQARRAGAQRVEVDTTNDNTAALRFYQRNGFRIAQCRNGAFRDVLRIKGLNPDTELTGQDGIPIRDVFRLSLDIPDNARRTWQT